MIRQGPADLRALRTDCIDADLVVVGGGMAGVCAAITAARQGIKVVLVQDRPILGGNAGSEFRLWILGATSHMGNNNRWAREGGVIDEILVENTYRNPEGNAIILDTILLEKVVEESNITLLLNTAVYGVEKADADTISSVRAFCSQNSTLYHLQAPLFCDASGDGVVGFQAGAAFRMGAESADEFGEGFAPNEDFGHMLGHSIYFYTRDTQRPVKFIAPSYANKDISQVFRYRSYNLSDNLCHLWWIEYGGRLDTIHETETIKWELWKVIYGIWDHVKNSGEFPESENYALEWVGLIPGKRESRRFEGDYILRQQDIVEQRLHDDAVSFGGWALDLHPSDGVYSDKPGCTQYHSKGVYQIPYRCMYSRNIKNLFLAGRIISASHVAFGSSRVMATCAHGGQAVGVAAALCTEQKLMPRALAEGDRLRWLQRRLLGTGQYIPQVRLADGDDLTQSANLSASSTLRLGALSPDGPMIALDNSYAMMLPLKAGATPKVSYWVSAKQDTTLEIELRCSSRTCNHSPDETLATKKISLSAGEDQRIELDFDADMPHDGYAFYCLMANPLVSVRSSQQRVTGVLAVTHKFNGRVASGNNQKPPEGSGIDSFEFWRPLRRPEGRLLALEVEPAIDCYKPVSVRNGFARPISAPNAWVAERTDEQPALSLTWKTPQKIARIELTFDTDYDHPMESVLMGHPERVMPFCVRSYRIRDGLGRVLINVNENHQTRNVHTFSEPHHLDRLVLEIDHPSEHAPAALFELRCYAGSPHASSASSPS